MPPGAFQQKAQSLADTRSRVLHIRSFSDGLPEFRGVIPVLQLRMRSRSSFGR